MRPRHEQLPRHVQSERRLARVQKCRSKGGYMSQKLQKLSQHRRSERTQKLSRE